MPNPTCSDCGVRISSRPDAVRCRPCAGKLRRRDVIVRILEKVDVRDVGYESPCWIWTASLSTNGYAQISVGKGMRRPHRVLYESVVGPVPTGLDLDHLCRRRDCVNPEHLEPVTRRENARRGAKGLLITHCPQGHEYTEENVWRHPRLGWRMCRQCNRDRATVHRQKARAA